MDKISPIYRQGILKRSWQKLVYRPGTNKIYWEKVISIIVVLTVFGVWAYFNQIRVDRLKKQRNRYAKYTIGVTTGSYNTRKSGRYIDYKYQVGGLVRKGDGHWPMLDLSVMTNGGWYYVKFDSTDPDNSEMLFWCPVLTDVKVAPENGWKEQPLICVDTQ